MQNLELSPEQEKKHTEITTEVDRAIAYKVKTSEQSVYAQEWIGALRNKHKELDQTFKFSAAKEAAKEAHKKCCDVYNAFTDPFKKAAEALRSEIKTFELEEAKKQRKAEDDAEAKRKQDEADEKAKLENKAGKELDKGNTEKAESLLDQADNVSKVPAYVPPPAPAAKGTSKKLVWKGKVVDHIAACKAIGERKLPATVVSFNEAGLNKLAVLYAGSMKIDGIEFYEDIDLRVRSN